MPVRFNAARWGRLSGDLIMFTRPTYGVRRWAPRYCPHTDALMGSSHIETYPARSEAEALAVLRRQAHISERYGDDSFELVTRDDGGVWRRFVPTCSAALEPTQGEIPF